MSVESYRSQARVDPQGEGIRPLRLTWPVKIVCVAASVWVQGKGSSNL